MHFWPHVVKAKPYLTNKILLFSSVFENEHLFSVSLFEVQSLGAAISESKLYPSGSFSSQLFLEHFQVNWKILNWNEF